MEQSQFLFWFVINFIIFILAEIVITNTQKRALMYVISGVFFAVLSIIALDIQTIVYDSSSGFVGRNEATYTYQYLYAVFFNVIMFIYCFISAFIVSTRVYQESIQGLKIPEGF